MIKYQVPGMSSERGGFTLIELIITIIVLGIVMIPLGFMSLEYVQGIAYSRESVIAKGLAETEMAKINNLSYSDVTLADGYDNTTSSYEGYAVDLNRKVDYVAGSGNNLKKVEVSIYDSSTSTQLARLVTYAANVSFGAGSGGATPGSGDQADSFSLSGGEIKKKKLEKITVENTGSSQIVITKVMITFTGNSGIQLKKIKEDKTELWSGTANSGDIITLDNPFTMDAGTSYDKNKFEFSKDVSTVTIDYYEFEDETQTGSYSW